MKILRLASRGFTMIELLIGMTIFAIGMTAILALLHSTIESSWLSRHEVTASNLLRQQIELVKNQRNTNYRNFAAWNMVYDGTSSYLLTGGLYQVSNNYSDIITNYDSTGNISRSPVSIKRVGTFSLGDTLETKFMNNRLYKDDHGRFTYSIKPNTTNYAAYLSVSPLIVIDGGVDHTPTIGSNYQGYILDARVITKGAFGYREYDLKTVITDWNN